MKKEEHEYLDKVKSQQKSISKLDICLSCPNITALYTCKLCNCFMPAKILVSGSCPDGKF
jgi:hypothetical protein